ncbi:MAG: DUF2127 domain-containing protein [Verrucomicrobia bacterium]|nr:DUF2127 domain-containing protein [Verrucomicrobiota bacterium]
MPVPHPIGPPKGGAVGLYTVIGVKLAKGLLFLMAALGIYSLLGDDLAAEFEKVLVLLRQNPDHGVWAMVAAKLDSLTPTGVASLALGSLLYAVLLFVESLGLSWRCGWAVWLAIGETAFFIPLEVIELVRVFRLGVAVLLVANAAIVWYLTRNRRRLLPTG